MRKIRTHNALAKLVGLSIVFLASSALSQGSFELKWSYASATDTSLSLAYLDYGSQSIPDFNGDGAVDLVIEIEDDAMGGKVLILDGVTGSEIWSHANTRSIKWGEFDGDAQREIVLARVGVDGEITIIDGLTGITQVTYLGSFDRFHIIDIDNDGLDELILKPSANTYSCYDYSDTAVRVPDDVSHSTATSPPINHPNPFNSSTTVTFSLDQRSSVDVIIYNSIGQLVRRLRSGELSAGTHSVVWDGLNDDGAMVSTGVYYYQVQQDNLIESGKMILIK